MVPLKNKLQAATASFHTCADLLREQPDRDVIAYYADDLTEYAIYLVNSWLMLQDASRSAVKQEIARFYISEALPKMHARESILRSIDPSVLQARELVMTAEA